MSEDRDTEQVSSTWLAQLRHEHGIYGSECARLQKDLDSSRRMFENAVMTIVTIGEAAGVRGEDQQNGHLEIVEAINKIKGRRAVYKAKATELERELEVWRSGPVCWSCGDSGQVHSLDGEWRGECNCQGAVDARRIAELEADRNRIKTIADNYSALNMDAQAELAALKAQGVVMPERDSFMAGVKAASDKVKAIVEDYDHRHGITDPDTGTREYPGNGEEWVGQMFELIEDFTGIVAPSSLNAAPAQQVSVPQCVLDWFEAMQAHVTAVDAYNSRLAFVREHMPFGTSVDPEYQIMEAADRKARILIGAMFIGLRDLAAAPVAPDGHSEAWPRSGDRCLCPACCHSRKSPAAPAAPAADAGLVEALGYQVLFDAIAAATSVYANGAINISVQAFRDALAAHRAQVVV